MTDERRFSVVPFTPADDLVDEDYLLDVTEILERIRRGVEAGEYTGFAYVLSSRDDVVSGYRRDMDRDDCHHLHSGAMVLREQICRALFEDAEEWEEDDDE